MTIFTPQSYDAAEREAMKRLPNRVIEAAGVVTFQTVGYPTRVSSVEELWRYADCMHEDRLKVYFDGLIGLTEREFELVSQLTQVVADLTQTLCRHRVVPGASLMAAIPVYRAIKLHLPNGGRVFELGPGAGYVGALLVADGYRYWSSDVGQAFFLWQGHLLRALRPDIESFQYPWWDWLTLAAPPEVDVFTANHMLNEMHPHALIHAGKMAKRMIGEDGVFVVEHFGSEIMRSTELTRKTLEAQGIVLNEIGPTREQVGFARGWSDLENMWAAHGGVPRSEDEKFMNSLRIS